MASRGFKHSGGTAPSPFDTSAQGQTRGVGYPPSGLTPPRGLAVPKTSPPLALRRILGNEGILDTDVCLLTSEGTG